MTEIAESFVNELDALVRPNREQFVSISRSERIYQNRDFNSFREYKELVKILVQEDCERSLKEYKIIQFQYEQALEEYYGSQIRIIRRFKEALFEKNNAVRSPRADFLWNKCWESCHSSGLAAVETMFDEWATVLHL